MEDGERAAPVGRKWHVLGLALLAAAGAYAVVESLRLGLWRQSSPGEGLYPFLMAGAVTAFSLAALAALMMRPQEAPKVPGADDAADEADVRGIVWRVSMYLAGLIFYAAALEALGFVASTVIVVAFILRIAEGYSWRTTLAVAAGTAVGCQILFVRWLGALLPAGTLWDRFFN